MASARPNLSKTLFQVGLQCHKKLWLQSRRRELATPPDAATRARLRMGHVVGALAHQRWPGGVLVSEAPARHARAVDRTRELLADPSVPAVFEAALEHEGIRVRADAIVRGTSGLELVEVKASSRLKNEHITDVAIQLHVAEGMGLAVGAVGLMHLEPSYVWHGGDYDVERLFTIDDVTERARASLGDVVTALPAMRAVLAADEAPPIAIGRHCSRPYMCPFKEHCWREAPAHHVTELPSAGRELLGRLEAADIADVRDIPADGFALTAMQERVRAATVAGEPRVSYKQLRRSLSALQYPITFLDFETWGPVLPVYPGTRPHEVIPFQWSAHIEHADGRIEHREFLWTQADDPRPAFVGSLLRALPASGSVVVYSAYEESRLRALAELLPGDGGRLLELFVARGVDLLEIVRATVYDPGFHGSFSLKRVLPALVPDLGYEGMAIADGMAAAAAYAELIDPATDRSRREQLAGSLREYCKLDTLAELRLLERLRSL